MTPEELVENVAREIDPEAFTYNCRLGLRDQEFARETARAALRIVAKAMVGDFVDLREKHGHPNGSPYQQGVWDHGHRLEGRLRSLIQETKECT